jgi:hypothetical protein
MHQDHIIKEVRKIRREIEEELGNDFQKYYMHLQQFQCKYKNLLVRRTPKPAIKLAKVI